MKVPPPRRIQNAPNLPNIGLLAAVVLWLLALYTVGQLFSSTPLLGILRGELVLVIPLYGLLRWIRTGHGWLATLSWTLPLAVLLTALEFAQGPPLIRGIAIVAGVLLGAAMIGLPEAAQWWYRKVLRTNPPA